MANSNYATMAIRELDGVKQDVFNQYGDRVSGFGLIGPTIKDFTVVRIKGSALISIPDFEIEAFAQAMYEDEDVPFGSDWFVKSLPYYECATYAVEEYVRAYVATNPVLHTRTVDFDAESAAFVCINHEFGGYEVVVSVDYEVDMNGRL